MKTLKQYLIATLSLAFIFLLAGCNSPMNSGEKETNQNEEGQMEQLGKKLDQEKAELQQQIQESVASFNKRMDEYEKRMKEAGKTIDKRTDMTMMNLRMKRDTLLLQMEDIGEKTQENWNDFKADMNRQSDEFQEAVNDFFTSNDSGNDK